MGKKTAEPDALGTLVLEVGEILKVMPVSADIATAMACAEHPDLLARSGDERGWDARNEVVGEALRRALGPTFEPKPGTRLVVAAVRFRVEDYAQNPYLVLPGLRKAMSELRNRPQNPLARLLRLSA